MMGNNFFGPSPGSIEDPAGTTYVSTEESSDTLTLQAASAIDANAGAGGVDVDSVGNIDLNSSTGNIILVVASTLAISLSADAGKVVLVNSPGSGDDSKAVATTEWAQNEFGGAGVTSKIEDADADTKVDTEESADEDHIRFDTASQQRMDISDTGAFDIDSAAFDLDATGNITLNTANVTDPGDILAVAGNATGGSNAGGVISLTAGDGNGAGAGGDITLTAGTGGTGGSISLVTPAAGDPGNVNLTAGAGSFYAGGDINITAGAGAGATSGDINIKSGAGNAQTGVVLIQSGNTTGSSSVSGKITVTTGTTQNGVTGDIEILTAAPSGGSANSGQIDILTGAGGAAGHSGVINIKTGNGGSSSPITIETGTGIPSGGIILKTGAAGAGTSGDITIQTGSGSTRGTITLNAAAGKAVLVNSPGSGDDSKAIATTEWIQSEFANLKWGYNYREAGSFIYPAADPAPYQERTATNVKFGEQVFDKTTPESIEWAFDLPAIASGTVTITIKASAVTADGNEVQLRFSHAAVDKDEDIDTLSYTAEDSGDYVTNATQNALDEIEIIETIANLGWASHDRVYCQLWRIAIDDGITVQSDYGVQSVRIRYPEL
jgi:hypothetical protein